MQTLAQFVWLINIQMYPRDNEPDFSVFFKEPQPVIPTGGG